MAWSSSEASVGGPPLHHPSVLELSQLYQQEVALSARGVLQATLVMTAASRSSVYGQAARRQQLTLYISKQSRIDEGSSAKILPPPSIASPRRRSVALKTVESVYTGSERERREPSEHTA